MPNAQFVQELSKAAEDIYNLHKDILATMHHTVQNCKCPAPYPTSPRVCVVRHLQYRLGMKHLAVGGDV